MFETTRKRIIISIAVFLTAFMAVTLSVVYLSSYNSVQRENMEMLSRYVEIYTLEAPPGEMRPQKDGHPPDDNKIFKLSSFYSVAIGIGDGRIIAVDTGINGIYEEEYIVSLAKELLEKGDNEGSVDQLMYRIENKNGYVLVAFMDTTLTEDNFMVVLINALTAGVFSMIVLCIVAGQIAKRIVRPLEENDQKQKQFISDAGHELKTPVSIISANSELLSRQLGDNQWLSNIRYENERMSNLIKNLLELSRAERNVLKTENINLSEAVSREVLPFESIAFEKGLIIDSDIEDKIFVAGNMSRVSQLISILIDNAISHVQGGDSIDVRLKKDRRSAVFSIANSGEKIPDEVKEKIFDRFFRLDEARTDSGGHYGLGLSIAKAITENMNGKISVDYENKKVVFTVILPLNS